MSDERIARKQVVADLKSSQFQRSFQKYILQLLADEREKYEMTVASEFQRGRISMLRDMLSLTKE